MLNYFTGELKLGCMWPMNPKEFDSPALDGCYSVDKSSHLTSQIITL